MNDGSLQPRINGTTHLEVAQGRGERIQQRDSRELDERIQRPSAPRPISLLLPHRSQLGKTSHVFETAEARHQRSAALLDDLDDTADVGSAARERSSHRRLRFRQ